MPSGVIPGGAFHGKKMEKLKNFLKEETVLCVAALLAISSMLVVYPSKNYIEYIDLRVLTLLYSLMLVVAGLKKEGVFENLMRLLAGFVHNSRQLYLVLVLANFIFSMLITNDVSLLTLVPFAIMVLHRTDQKKLLSFTIVMQTIAANLGSMCTPIGNPQNLYLYTVSAMEIGEFMGILMPYTVTALVLLLGSALLVPSEEIKLTDMAVTSGKKSQISRRTVCYIMLFGICLLTILRILPYGIMLLVVVVAIAVIQPVLFKRADYMLLMTFVAFFIFVGNVKNMEAAGELLNQYVTGYELPVSVVLSQVISNVPAAVLLSGFTDNYRELLIGTNLGGLGTLIASMASLISYKLYVKTQECDVKKYMLLFTFMNVVFLAVLAGVALFTGIG